MTKTWQPEYGQKTTDKQGDLGITLWQWINPRNRCILMMEVYIGTQDAGTRAMNMPDGLRLCREVDDDNPRNAQGLYKEAALRTRAKLGDSFTNIEWALVFTAAIDQIALEWGLSDDFV